MSLITRIALFVFCLFTFPVAAGTISGKVTDVAGNGISGVKIGIYDENAFLVDSITTDSDGWYSSDYLELGIYYLATSNNDAYVDQIFPNESCGGSCLYSPHDYNATVLFGSPIELDSQEVRANINFELKKRQLTLSFVDKSTSEIIENVNWTLYDATGRWIDSYQGSNYYDQTIVNWGIPAGEYYIAVSKSGYLLSDEDKYSCTENICPSIYINDDEQLAKIVVSSEEAITRQINIQVNQISTDPHVNEKLVTISGTVSLEKDSSIAARASRLKLWNIENYKTYTTYLSDTGEYTLEIPAGKYRIKALPYSGSRADFVLSCDLENDCYRGVEVNISSDLSAVQLDFLLIPSAKISGKVIEAGTGKTIEAGKWNDYGRVEIYSIKGDFIQSAVIHSDGTYESTVGMVPGSYMLCFSRSFNIHYVPSCIANSEDLVKEFAGSEYHFIKRNLSVSKGQVLAVDFKLQRGASIAGYVEDAKTLKPLRNAFVSIFNSEGGVSFSKTDDSGFFTSNTILVGGNYKIRVEALGYVSQCYRGKENCNWRPRDEEVEAISVKPKEQRTDIAFSLARSSKILARLKGETANKYLPSVYAYGLTEGDIYGSVGSGGSDAFGRLVIDEIPDGKYTFVTSPYPGYFSTNLVTGRNAGIGDSEWRRVSESNLVYLGKAENLSLGMVELEAGPYITGAVKTPNGFTGGFLVIGSNFTMYSAHYRLGGYASEALPDGDYIVYTQNFAGLVDKLHTGDSYAGTDLNGVQKLFVAASSNSFIRTNFDLQPGNFIRGNVKMGDQIRVASVQIFDNLGKLVAFAPVLDNGEYRSLQSLPNGKYFILALLIEARTNKYVGLALPNGEVIDYKLMYLPDFFPPRGQRLNVNGFEVSPNEINNSDVMLNFDITNLTLDEHGNENNRERNESSDKLNLTSLNIWLLLTMFSLLLLRPILNEKN